MGFRKNKVQKIICKIENKCQCEITDIVLIFKILMQYNVYN